MKLLRKQMLLCSILFLVFTLSACSAIGQTDENNLTDSATSAEKTVSVVRGTITPTVSTQTTIVPAVPFIIFSPENGIFNTAVELEEKITAGQIIGTVNGKELKSPVDGTITSIAPSNESVPSNYPVAIVHYTGFALNVEADNFLSTLPEYAELKAKFQVYDGVGPTDMIAVVSPAADENAFTGIVPQEGILQGGSLEVVINKEAKNYFNDSPYAAGNVKSTLSLTPFNIVGVVNDGRDFPTIYADSAAILNFAPAMWQVQNANVYWHPTTGLTIEQIHSALGDILTDTIGGYWESAGRSDIGDTYDSVLSILQLGLLVTSLLLLFVSVLGQINIGLSSLEQRTHELLIRRAIGASRTNIVALVLGSQLILSIFVCFAAILISLILVHCIGALLPVDSPVGTPSYPISVAVVAVAVSVLTALLGGLLPAWKASKLEPALALR